MRNNRNSFALALALTTVLTASSAVAAARNVKSPTDGPNVIVRIIESIKKHVVHALDGVISNPPSDQPH